MTCQPFVISLISLLAALTADVGCGGNGGPTGPSGIRERPTGPTYTISGVITEYHGGPLSGVGVTWLQCNYYWGISCDTRTD